MKLGDFGLMVGFFNLWCEMKILAVDNYPLMIRFIEKLFENGEHEVKTAGDGLAALEVLKSFTPDVIFVDLIMPNIDGKKFCQIIRQKPLLKDTYIVVLSAVAVEEANDFRLFGADACIAKGPFDIIRTNILEVIEQLKTGMKTKADSIKGKEYAYQRTITKELIYLKRHFEVILSNMSEGIMELTDTGYIIFVNNSACHILGSSEENLLGSSFFDLFKNSEKQKIKKRFSMVQKKREPQFGEDHVKFKGNLLLINFIPIVQYEEHSILVIIEDITEKVRIETQLKHAMKMGAIGTLSGGIAHDFNNLLMGIQGNISVMLLETSPTYPLYECLKNIEKIVKSGSDLTEKLLGYARKGKYETKVFDLNQLVAESAEIFGRTKKEVQIELELDKALKPVEGDRVQIEQVLLNLYVNAWQAMPDGGMIWIETKNVTHNDIQSDIYNVNPGKYAQVNIRDNGIGMEEAVLEKIFDPFFTTKDIGRGTGLGLASAYGIIKNHKGYLEAESKKGEGSKFTFSIPASGKKLFEADEKMQDVSERKTILLVDDEPVVLNAGERMLQILGYEVISARGGKEAVHIFREKANSIDLVILDIIMPEVGGAEVYSRIKEIRSDVKVLISSGYSMDSLQDQIKLEDSDSFLQKPYNFKQLFGKIRDFLD